MVKIAPSLLSADCARLGEMAAAAETAGADYLHVDVMDGQFVPNITMGPVVVKAIRQVSRLPLDVHLMIEKPERHLEAFAQAGADILTVHAEASIHLHRTVQAIKTLGLRAGVSLNPASPLVWLEEIIEDVDLILLMTVNPGFGGQVFIENCLKKIAVLRKNLDDGRFSAELEVDGGIKAENAARVVEAGADILVAGSAIFGSPEGIEKALHGLRAEALKAPRLSSPAK